MSPEGTLPSCVLDKPVVRWPCRAVARLGWSQHPQENLVGKGAKKTKLK